MQNERRHSGNDAATPHTCGTCSSHGEEVHEEWMCQGEHWYDCDTARTAIGMVEANEEYPCWKIIAGLIY